MASCFYWRITSEQTYQVRRFCFRNTSCCCISNGDQDTIVILRRRAASRECISKEGEITDGNN
eukprot:scaffold6835_cov26-Tisochrysis_lutea.AAC.2